MVSPQWGRRVHSPPSHSREAVVSLAYGLVPAGLCTLLSASRAFTVASEGLPEHQQFSDLDSEQEEEHLTSSPSLNHSFFNQKASHWTVFCPCPNIWVKKINNYSVDWETSYSSYENPTEGNVHGKPSVLGIYVVSNIIISENF